MIIFRYIIRNNLISQLIILLILFLIFFSQKLIKLFSIIIDGKIPANITISLLGLEIPEMMHLILPLSLFLGLLVTLNKMHNNNEIIIMYACGLSKKILIKATMILALYTGSIELINVMWISPWASYNKSLILSEIKANPDIGLLNQGNFQQLSNNDSIIFIRKINNNRFYGIFIAQLFSKKNNNSSVIITSNSGCIKQCKNGFKNLVLYNGIRFEENKKLGSSLITNFYNYQATIESQKIVNKIEYIEQMNIFKLFNIKSNLAQAELNWRLNLIFIIFAMALIVVPLSEANINHNRYYSIILSILLYLIFFLFQICIKSNLEKGKVNTIFWIWIVNELYIFIITILNLWDTVIMRRIRNNIMQRIFKGKFNANI